MKIFIASDHRGFELKKSLSTYLTSLNHEVFDLGPLELNPTDDFPLYIVQVVKEILANPNSRGIVICKNGVGVSIMANRSKGIRCALSWSPEHAKTTRNDDDSNVLALPSEFISEKEAELIVKTWLETPFANEERFRRRLAEIENLSTNL